MDLIQQQDDSTCGVACAAMVAGVPFEIAHSKAKEFVTKRGMGPREMGTLLRRLGVRFTRLMIPELKRCVPHIVVVPSLNHVGGNHYVVVDLSNEFVEVYDPQAGRPGKAFYRRRYGVDEGTGSIDFQSYAEVIRIDGVRPFSSANRQISKKAKYSKEDTNGKLYVDCSECECGGNGQGGRGQQEGRAGEVQG